jgi:hypothetical protein
LTPIARVTGNLAFLDSKHDHRLNVQLVSRNNEYHFLANPWRRKQLGLHGQIQPAEERTIVREYVKEPIVVGGFAQHPKVPHRIRKKPLKEGLGFGNA